MPDLKPTEAPMAAPVAASTIDLLDYVADLILELQQMAEPTPCLTLKGLLGLAHAEALIRREEVVRTSRRPG